MSKSAKSKSKTATHKDAVPAQAKEERRPTTEDIARRAFEIYLERNCADGHDVEDWLQAERELREEK